MSAYQIARIISLVLDVYYVLLLVRVVFSWLNIRRPHPILVQIHHVSYVATEPLLRPIRNFMMRYQQGAPIDLSPLIAWFLIEIVRRLIIRALV